MQTVEQVLAKLGGVTKVAAAIEAPLGTVSAWQTRKSIPPGYWLRLVALAHECGADLTYERLAEIAAARAQESAQ